MSAFRKKGCGCVNAGQILNFTFDGRHYQGHPGDTLASALLANGVHLVGRSFKYHRPRGFLGAGSEEANALVTFDRGPGRITPNLRATTLELFNGLVAHSQNNWPTLRFDLGAFNDAFSWLFPAGFYNKTFMWPKSFWDKVYEPAIRKMAGLGPAPKDADKDHYASMYTHCEVLVVGGGPAGIAAAMAASEHGERVILVDEHSTFGGSLLGSPKTEINNQNAWQWVAGNLALLAKRKNVTLLPRTTAIGYYHDNFLALVQRLTDHQKEISPGSPRECMHKVRAGKVILATGAIERPLVFHGNDRPGVMLASAAQIYLNRYGVAVGDNIAVFTTHDSAYAAAFALSDASARIAAIIDTRKDIPAALLQAANMRAIAVLDRSVVCSTSGRLRINGIQTGAIKDRQVDPSTLQKMKCDCLLMSGGWTPSVHLFSHSRGTLRWDEGIGASVPDRPNENTVCVGACNGRFDLDAALEEAAKAGGKEARYTTKAAHFGAGETWQSLPGHGDPSRVKAFVDFQNDVTEKDINLAIREGFHSIEHVKRYTTTGMATDQGKTSNLNAAQIAARALRVPVAQTGLTTFRPPYTPTSFGAFVGHRSHDLFAVTRKTAIDIWAENAGAVFEPVGLWRRARYFPKGDENMGAAVARECIATRTALGILDSSTLGKIEIVGPDAAAFMDMMYTSAWSKLAPGRCRYGLMLREDGFIMDDGVIGRLAGDRFHVTTTTGGAPVVFRMMEDYLQTQWPHLDVWLTSISEQWAVIALNGPCARKTLEPLVEGIDLSREAFPHMAVREGKICGVETRLFRVSFSGELGFEINVPAHFGKALWEILMAAGEQYNITPYGTEAMHVMRAEKGYLIVGQDTDGTVTPDDAGMSWAIAKKKPDFVGKRSLARAAIQAPGRKQLVGLLTDDPETVLEEGAQIVADPAQAIPMEMIGHVTSSCWSSTLNHSIAFALVKNGRAHMGERVYIPMQKQTHSAKICSTVFYDPEGERLNVV